MPKYEIDDNQLNYILNVLTSTPLQWKDTNPIVASLVEQHRKQQVPDEEYPQLNVPA